MFTSDDLLKVKGIQSVSKTFNGSHGGFKQVFLCKVDGVDTAVKVTKIADANSIQDITLKRLQRELELLSELNSNYLPKFGTLPIQTFSKDSEKYIIYSEQFIDGADVCELMLSNFFKKTENVTRLVHDVVSAIQIYWNHNRTVHRDIKPANIRHSKKSNDFILIDAGIALIRDRTTITPTGNSSPRTPIYTSPEVVKQERNLSFKTDLFSLGIVLYEACVGKHPFYQPGMSQSEINDAIVNKELKITNELKNMPNDLGGLIIKMLEKRPHQRPNNLSAIIALTNI